MSSSSLESHSQPARPDRYPRDFISLRGPRGKEFDENAHIRLHLLCEKCQALGELLRKEFETLGRVKDGDMQHYETASLLKRSSERGCHLCALIWGALSTSSVNIKETDAIVMAWYSRQDYQGQRRWILGPKIQSWASYPLVDLHIEQCTDFILPPLTMSMSSISTKASTCTLFYKRCKEICDKTHTNCHIKRVKQLPTRLLYVTPAPSGTATVQLVSSVDMGLPPDTEFAALSYCWGKNYRLRLLTTNYRDLTVDTPFDQLPAIIQDAVLVTIELGLQYLWVDALCIMQDSHEDWSHEAARMCDVYEGCSIALAASGASDSEQGLYTVRDPLLQTPCILSGNLRVSTGRMKLESYRVLETRGWAMQEHLLPSRAIKFGSYVYWTCRELSINEFGRYESEEHLGAATQEFFPLVLKPATMDPVDAPRIRLMWWRIWTTYMAAGLSKKSDNLAAISGVISAIERRTGWTSVHGLWEPFIIQELLWFKSWPVKTEQIGVGPSWSWASRYRGLRAEPLDISIEWKDLAEYVPMDGRDQSSSPAVIELSGVLCRTDYLDDIKRRILLSVEGWPAPICANYDQRSWQAGDMALPLCFKGKGSVHGLIVAPTRKSMTYERVGYFRKSCGLDFAKALQRSDGEPFVRRKILLE